MIRKTTPNKRTVFQKPEPPVEQVVQDMNREIRKNGITITECLDRLPKNTLVTVHNGRLSRLYCRNETIQTVKKQTRNIKDLPVRHVSHDLNFRVNPDADKDAHVAILEI